MQSYLDQSTNTSVEFVNAFDKAAFEYFHELEVYALGVMDYAQKMAISTGWFAEEDFQDDEEEAGGSTEGEESAGEAGGSTEGEESVGEAGESAEQEESEFAAQDN